jgi:tight adherence protein B
MVATAIGGVAYVFIYPLLSGERKVEQRRANVARAEPPPHGGARRSRAASRSKRRSRTRRQAKKPKNSASAVKIAQAGLSLVETISS